MKGLLTNKGYTHLSDMSNLLSQIVAAAASYRGTTLFAPGLVKQCNELSTQATRTVSVTYALYHIHLKFPKNVGPHHTREGAADLVSELKKHGTFPLLPPCVQTHLETLAK